MANFMQRGTSWLGQQLLTVGERRITYQQGDLLLSLVAVPSEHEYAIEGDDGITTLVPFVNWIVRGKAFQVASITPQPGDRIEENLLDVGPVAYEVLPAGRLPCWAWFDTSAQLFVLRTKKIG